MARKLAAAESEFSEEARLEELAKRKLESEDFEKIYSETQIIIEIRNGLVYFVIILSSSA